MVEYIELRNIIQGAIGTIFVLIFLKICQNIHQKIIQYNIGLRLYVPISSLFLIKYAENKHFVKKCEENNRSELIALNYSMTMSKFTRVQILFIITLMICLIFGAQYLTEDNISLLIPIVFTLLSIKNLYDLIVWYFATLGCLPDEGEQFKKEIKEMKNKNRYIFIMNALKGNNP